MSPLLKLRLRFVFDSVLLFPYAPTTLLEEVISLAVELEKEWRRKW